MSDQTRIEWTDATWNPIRGCTKISPGCKHCYAETFAERFRGVPGHPYERGFDLRTVPEKLADPLRWRASRMIFVNSMSDLFHRDVPDDYIDAVVRVMLSADWHTYQVLTKRSERLRDLLAGRLREAAGSPHIWWGVSVENRRDGLPRIEHLRESPARVRFLSVEPLLEDLGRLDLDGIHWVILGGESGPGARPMDPDWARSVRDRCREAGVPFFFKQWGGTRKGKTGRILDDRTHDDRPTIAPRSAPDDHRRKAMVEELTSEVGSPAVLLPEIQRPRQDFDRILTDIQTLETLREEIWSSPPLEQIARSLRACREQDLSREQVRTYLESIRGEAPDEETEDRILEVLDLVTGFCSPEWSVWPDPAPK